MEGSNFRLSFGSFTPEETARRFPHSSEFQLGNHSTARTSSACNVEHPPLKATSLVRTEGQPPTASPAKASNQCRTPSNEESRLVTSGNGYKANTTAPSSASTASCKAKSATRSSAKASGPSSTTGSAAPSSAKASGPSCTTGSAASSFAKASGPSSTTGSAEPSSATPAPVSAWKSMSGSSLFSVTSSQNSVTRGTTTAAKESTAQSVCKVRGSAVAAGGATRADDASPPLSQVSVAEDSAAKALQGFLQGRELRKHVRTTSMRGLRNRGNNCYIHTVLQAIQACSPLSCLLADLRPILTSSNRPKSSTPVLDAASAFFCKFEQEPVVARDGDDRKEDGFEPAGRSKRAPRQASREDTGPQLSVGAPFEPTEMYDVMKRINKYLSVNGKQEDAEEFLSAFLNRLHEEMLAVLSFKTTETAAAPEPVPEPSADSDTTGWEEVSGKKNKSAITRSMSVERTPVTALFSGVLRSSILSQGSKESATLEPFMCLPLHIQDERVFTLQEALTNHCRKERLDGFTTGRNSTEADKKTSLSQLPPILIVQLKRFVFTSAGGIQKVHKHVKYPFKLNLSRELLSAPVATCPVGSLSYLLTAVVYHHGESAHGGHYTADVRHESSGRWVRCDDSHVQALPDGKVMNLPKGKTPYLLFYRRKDESSS